MEQARSGLDRLYNCISNAEFLIGSAKSGDDTDFIKALEERKQQFIDALDDDFNTALAISVLFEISKDTNTHAPEATKEGLQYAVDLLRELGGVLNILTKKEDNNLDAEIQELIDKRQQARKEKNFALADEIRDNLAAQGIILEDTPQGVKWKRG